MNTRKYPRTMNEAFGPYAKLDVEYEIHPHDKLVCWTSVLVALVLAVILWLE